MFRKNESNKSQIITFHKNMLFALNDGNIKSRGLEMNLHNILNLLHDVLVTALR
jgi:hypothetical protein